MRGAVGVERSLVVEEYWPDVDQRDLHRDLQKVFREIYAEALRQGIARPTMYARMTFAISGRTSGFYVGSRSIGKKTAQSKLDYWFVRSGISYTLAGVHTHTAQMLYDASEQIHEAIASSADADLENDTTTEVLFHLEFITARAYQVKRQVMPS